MSFIGVIFGLVLTAKVSFFDRSASTYICGKVTFSLIPRNLSNVLLYMAICDICKHTRHQSSCEHRHKPFLEVMSLIRCCEFLQSFNRVLMWTLDQYKYRRLCYSSVRIWERQNLKQFIGRASFVSIKVKFLLIKIVH